MKISVKAITLSSGILWGALMLLVGLIRLVAPSYGTDFLRVMSSVYPGTDPVPTVGSALLGTVYGFVDGAIAGCLFGLIYDAICGSKMAAPK